MVFSSIIFVFFFLPIVLAGYYLLSLPALVGFAPKFWRQMSNLFLLLASLVFYFWGENFLIWIIITTTSIDYICGLLISGGLYRRKIQKLEIGAPRTRLQKLGLLISICSNLGFICVFKYFNFGVDSYNNLVTELGLSAFRWNDAIRITLPLGISFYTFQSMSYTIDVYRGYMRATRNLINFACYVTMFPQLVAGPIIRYKDVAKQLVHRAATRSLFVSGISRFILGLGKKVIIANTVAVPAEKIFALPANDLTTGVAWLGVVCYTLQIYFDFSGYSDMAIGLGRMFGFEFRENFDYPYISKSMREFWRRWHISLSTWFRDYLYIPLGGSHRSTERTYFNLIVVFFLCGLWHGAYWTFVVWGLYHGLFLILERLWLGEFLAKRHAVISQTYTLLVIMCGWVIFASDTFSHAISFLAAMSGFAKVSGTAHSVSWYLSRDVRIALIIGIVFSMPVLPALDECWKKFMISRKGMLKTTLELQFSFVYVIGLSLVLVISLMLLSAGTHNPFIYFRF